VVSVDMYAVRCDECGSWNFSQESNAL